MLQEKRHRASVSVFSYNPCFDMLIDETLQALIKKIENILS
jgi:hypothetical protein